MNPTKDKNGAQDPNRPEPQPCKRIDDEVHRDEKLDLLPSLERMQAISAIGLFLLAMIYTVYFSRAILLPVMIAALGGFVLAPIVRKLTGCRLPRPFAAFIVVTTSVLLLLAICTVVVTPASQFIANLPEKAGEIENRFRGLYEPIDDVVDAAQEMSEDANDDAVAVRIRGPGIAEMGIGYARSIGGTALISFVLLLMLLSFDEIFLHKAVRLMPNPRKKRLAIEVSRQVEHEVSQYLLTITLINITLGIVTSVATALLGVEDPILWGVLAGASNFVPVFGTCVTAAGLLMAGLTQYQSIWMGLAPALAFVILNGIEAMLITPTFLGRRLNLNPIIIVFAVVSWGFIWGIPGVLIAVPTLVVIKLIADRLQSLQPISELISGVDVKASTRSSDRRPPIARQGAASSQTVS